MNVNFVRKNREYARCELIWYIHSEYVMIWDIDTSSKLHLKESMESFFRNVFRPSRRVIAKEKVNEKRMIVGEPTGYLYTTNKIKRNILK